MLKQAKVFSLIVFIFALGSPALSQPEKYVAGTHYSVLSNPVRTADPSRIEVVEAFWYGCPHCFTFEPLIVEWAARNSAEIDFVRFPAMFNNLMKVHAQIFFTAESLDVLHLLHDSTYEALVLEKKQLQSEDQIGEFFATYGVAREDFGRAFNSFSVKTKLRQAESRMQEYDLRGTPNLIVNGKYRLMTGEAVRSQQELLDVLDFLISRER